MSTMSYNPPNLDSRPSQTLKPSAYSTGLKRAATITITGQRTIRSPQSPKMPRPVSMFLDREAAKQAIIYTLDLFVLRTDPTNRHQSLVKDDPFVTSNSEESDSVSSSENEASEGSSTREEVTPADEFTPATEPDEPVLAGNSSESFRQHDTMQFQTSKPRPASMSFHIFTPRHSLSISEFPSRMTTPEHNVPFQNRRPTTPMRSRPASVAIMTSPQSQSPTESSRYYSKVQFSAQKISPSQSPRPQSPSNNVNSAFQTTDNTQQNTPQTPPSMMRRFSCRLSITPRHQRDTSPTTSPSRTTMPQPGNAQSTSLSLRDLPPPAFPPLPTPNQLANLDRRNSQLNSQIMRTPPQMRARSNTAPRAASGAWRYGMFPEPEKDGIGRIAEDEDSEDAANTGLVKQHDPFSKTNPSSESATASASSLNNDSTDLKLSTSDGSNSNSEPFEDSPNASPSKTRSKQVRIAADAATVIRDTPNGTRAATERRVSEKSRKVRCTIM